MNRKSLLCLIGLFLLASFASSQSSKKSSGGAEKAVADLEQQWLKSQKTNNTELLTPLLAAKFVNTDYEGKVTDRTQAIAEAKATKYDSVDYDDVKVTVFGDTAIAIGGFKGKGTDPKGKAFDLNERFTDTWVKGHDGKWQCVASHQSSVKM